MSSGLSLGTLKLLEVGGAVSGVATTGGDCGLNMCILESDVGNRGDLFDDTELKAGETNGGDRARFEAVPMFEGGPGVLRSDIAEPMGDRARVLCGSACSSSRPFA